MASWENDLSPMFLYEKGGKNYQPQMTNHFKVEIYDLTGAEEITLCLQSFSLPNIETSPVQVYHGNGAVNFAGQPSLTGMNNMPVNDFITKDIEKIIVDWQKQVYDPETDKMGWAGDYKKEGAVTQFGPDGTEQRKWEVYGIWPSAVDYGSSFNYQGSDVKQVTMTLTYDRAWRA